MRDQDIAQRYLNKIKKCEEKHTDFTLTFYEFKRIITAKKCKYTGIELTYQTDHNQGPTDVTIDRVDNSKGYVNGNVVACCYQYNQFKSVVENPENIIDFKMLERALKVQKKLQGGML